MKLDDTDFLDSDREDALSTVHEVGIKEEDLKEPEIPCNPLARPERER